MSVRGRERERDLGAAIAAKSPTMKGFREEARVVKICQNINYILSIISRNGINLFGCSINLFPNDPW